MTIIPKPRLWNSYRRLRLNKTIDNCVVFVLSQYEYDAIIDSLYLKDRHDNRDTKNRREYSYHTADSMRKKRNREDSLNYLNEVKHIQLTDF